MNISVFLSEIGRQLLENSSDWWDDTNIYSVRHSWNGDRLRGGLWFRTSGCNWSKKGSCLICNYSQGPDTTSLEMVNFVKKGLKEFNEPLCELLVSPAGSMLDPQEVPIEARDMIFSILAKEKHHKFSFETRPETVQAKDIEKIQDTLDGRLHYVLLGVETLDQVYQQLCLNKPIMIKTCENAFKSLLNYNVFPVANVVMGMPFLTIKESILSAMKTTSWAIDMGAAYCYLFPIHIKQGTILEVLYNQGLYHPPSLWEIVEVMKQLKSLSRKSAIRPSWYTDLGAYNIIASPDTCDRCYDSVVELFDHYNRWYDDKSLDDLLFFSCQCRHEWYEKMENETPHSDSGFADKLLAGYAKLANHVGINWSSIHSSIKSDVSSIIENENTLRNSYGCFNNDMSVNFKQ